MYSNDERCRHRERESVTLEEARRLSGWISQDVGPSGGRLRHNVDEYQRERSCLGRVAEDVVDPAVQTARQCIAPAETAESEPFCAVWDVPDKLESYALALIDKSLVDLCRLTRSRLDSVFIPLAKVMPHTGPQSRSDEKLTSSTRNIPKADGIVP